MRPEGESTPEANMEDTIGIVRRSIVRRFFVMALVAGLIAGLIVPAEGKKPKKKPRTVTLEYSHPSYCADLFGAPCTLKTRKTDRYFKVSVTDGAGQNVTGHVSQNAHDDGYAPFCGAHLSAQSLRAPGKALTIYLGTGRCDDGSPALMTTGTIRVELSAKPF